MPSSSSCFGSIYTAATHVSRARASKEDLCEDLDDAHKGALHHEDALCEDADVVCQLRDLCHMLPSALPTDRHALRVHAHVHTNLRAELELGVDLELLLVEL